MSDTTIIASDSLGYDGMYETENYADGSRDSCCTRNGAKICVCILVLSTILIVIAVIFFIFGPYELQIFRKLKGQKNGKNSGSTNSGQGFINAMADIWSSSSDTADTSYNDPSYDNNNENANDY
ncbi:unnamed protein product [Rotaria sordida]|uniref:Uncharacterized protein n=1 Tax=Rotaria sordida TaxID=392033 RepID=A0A814BNZ5_9BILA|nr:unnamed protein product [Rotaria sordida]CAF1391829.1 unnamed protein product [Rotaria sordida]